MELSTYLRDKCGGLKLDRVVVEGKLHLSALLLVVADTVRCDA